jgi:hypothetical protein
LGAWDARSAIADGHTVVGRQIIEMFSEERGFTIVFIALVVVLLPTMLDQ